MIDLNKLNKDNWLETSNLSVTEEQKQFFPIPNVYWLGISRYEEKTTLYAIVCDGIIVGLLGLGYDEDGVSGFINPLMIDEKYQGNHYGEIAMKKAISILKEEYQATEIHLGHRKSNICAAKLYEKLDFEIIGEDDQDYFRKKVL